MELSMDALLLPCVSINATNDRGNFNVWTTGRASGVGWFRDFRAVNLGNLGWKSDRPSASSIGKTRSNELLNPSLISLDG